MTLPSAGLRDRRISIDRLTTMQSATGAAAETWALVATVWAQARPPTGRELLQAGQVTATIDQVFVILWRSDIIPTMRVRFDGQTWDITSVQEIGRREGLMISAVARKVV